MDSILATLLSFPPHPPPQVPLSDAAYDAHIIEQIDVVKKISHGKLLQQTSGGEHVLDVINPALNTVPYAFILNANISAANKGTKGVDIDGLWGKMTGFLTTFDPRQMRYLMKEFISIVDNVAQFARQSRQPDLAIPPIRDAILRFDPSGSVLTWPHIILAQLALESRAYALAAPVLEKPILYFPGAFVHPKPKHLCDMSLSPRLYITNPTSATAPGKFVYKDIIEYLLFSGMSFIGMRDWENALLCLENAVTYPAKDGSVSKVMAEAYKKWVLVGLLLEGRLLSLPKATSQGASKAYHILAKPYESLAQIFEGASASRLKSEAEIGQHIWQKDCNIGLVLEVLDAYQKFQIKRLGDVYTKISLPEILNQTMNARTGNRLPNVQALESLIQDMINRGELHATLSRPTTFGIPSILSFSPMGVVLTEAQIQKELAASIARIQVLAQEIKQTDRMLTYDKEYVKWMVKRQKSLKMSPDNMDNLMDWADVAEIDDEDIMGGGI